MILNNFSMLQNVGHLGSKVPIKTYGNSKLLTKKIIEAGTDRN